MVKADIEEKIKQRVENGSTIMDAFIDIVGTELVNGGKVHLRGFGTFCVVERQEKRARDITRNTEIIMPKRKIIKFKPSQFINPNGY